MAGMNETQVTEFMLLGFSHIWPFLFALFLAIYLTTLLGNSAILALVSLDPHLHSPMYFFLSQLSCLDLCYSSVTVPKILAILATILRMLLATSKHKALSTCSAHLLVVALHFTMANLNYNRPSSGCSPAADTLVSTLHCIVTAMLSPLIHSLCNQEVCGAVPGLCQGRARVVPGPCQDRLPAPRRHRSARPRDERWAWGCLPRQRAHLHHHHSHPQHTTEDRVAKSSQEQGTGLCLYSAGATC